MLDAWVSGAGSPGEAATRAFAARLLRHLESRPAGAPLQKVAACEGAVVKRWPHVSCGRGSGGLVVCGRVGAGRAHEHT